MSCLFLVFDFFVWDLPIKYFKKEFLICSGMLTVERISRSLAKLFKDSTSRSIEDRDMFFWFGMLLCSAKCSMTKFSTHSNDNSFFHSTCLASLNQVRRAVQNQPAKSSQESGTAFHSERTDRMKNCRPPGWCLPDVTHRPCVFRK